MIGDWIFDHIPHIVVMFILAMICLLLIAARQEHNKKIACIKSGHQWVEVDHTFQTTYVQSGNVMIPMPPQRVAIMGCR